MLTLNLTALVASYKLVPTNGRTHTLAQDIKFFVN